MPKIQAITNKMKEIADKIGDNVSLMQGSQINVKNCMSNILVHFESKPKVLTALHLANVTNGYRNSGESLNRYRDFLVNAADTYEWNDEQLARWKNTSIGDKINSAPDMSTGSTQDNASVSGENSTATSGSKGDFRSADFDSAVNFVLEQEGGYSNHPNDPGGSTNMGITQSTLDEARQQGIVSCIDVYDLKREEATKIYYENYWKPSNADKMPEPLATIYFDGIVLFGTYTGGILLQRAMESLGQPILVDGIVGPQTLAALNEQLKTPEDINALCSKMLDIRQGWHNNDANASSFIYGWTRRVNDLRDLIA